MAKCVIKQLKTCLLKIRPISFTKFFFIIMHYNLFYFSLDRKNILVNLNN